MLHMSHFTLKSPYKYFANTFAKVKFKGGFSHFRVVKIACKLQN